MQTDWHNKPYYSLDAYCKNTFGRKVYKIALDGGMTCPNRQSIHEQTAKYIRRHYPLSCYDECVAKLQKNDIPVITHVILGLPFETKDLMLETIEHLNQQSIFGIKLQLLHVLKETDLEIEYRNHKFDVLSMEEYLDILTECLERLSPQIVIHSVTGDGPKELLVAPLWSLNKRGVLNTLHQKMKQDNRQQGRAIYDTRTIDTL